MRAIFTLAFKDIRLLMRDKMGFFFVLVFPLLVAIFFGMIFSGESGNGTAAIPVVAVLEDGGDEAEAFLKKLEDGPELDVLRLADRNEAADLVRRGRRTAFIVVEDGFSEASRRMFWGEPMRLSLGVDPARRAEAGMLEGLITAAAFERMQGAFTDSGAMQSSARDALESVRSATGEFPERDVLARFLEELDTFLVDLPEAQSEDSEGGLGMGAWQPIEIARVPVAREQSGGPTSSYVISFPQGIVWGIMGCAAGFGISLVTERTRGTLVRLRMAPMAPWKVLAGKGMACFLTTIAVATFLLIVGAIVFGVRPQSFPLLVAAVVCSSIAFVGIMMLLSVMGRTEASAGGIGWAVLLVAGMFGGAMVPLFIMPAWVQTAGHASPVKWAILALEGALWRGFTPAEMVLPYTILIAIGVGGFLLGSRLFDWTERT